MRTKTFNVPQEIISRFFGFVDETMLQVKLVEINEDQEAVVDIGYTEDDKEAMMDLIELYGELMNSEEQEENEEEEENELKGTTKRSAKKKENSLCTLYPGCPKFLRHLSASHQKIIVPMCLACAKRCVDVCPKS